jgi:hypothetical protein
MRAASITFLLLVSAIAFCGCGSSSGKNEVVAAAQNPSVTAIDARAEFKRRCGDPVRFPITDECVQLAGDQGSTLKRLSELSAAVWRACSLTPSSAETIRQELVAKGGAKSPIGQKLIGEMERTEQHSDSPCVAADLRDLDCVAGNSDACSNSRDSDPACVAWTNDGDTQSRLNCINRAVHDSACIAEASDNSGNGDATAANSISDSEAQAEDCRRIEKACLHTFDECSNAKDALDQFLKPADKPSPPPAQ